MEVQNYLGQNFGDSEFSFLHPFHEAFSDTEFESSRRIVAERIRFEHEINREVAEPKCLPKSGKPKSEKKMRWSLILLGSCPEYGASFGAT